MQMLNCVSLTNRKKHQEKTHTLWVDSEENEIDSQSNMYASTHKVLTSEQK